MITRRNLKQPICSIIAAAVCAGCASTNPPPLPPGNAADPQISGRTRTPPNLLARDETTLAIAKELSQTESMQHEGMQHGDMQGMQHGAAAQPEKKAVADEMKAGAQIYTCPMHPQVQSDKPGKCPVCGMTLVKKKESK